MRALVFAVGLALAAESAHAETIIAAADAPKHVGETVTVEGSGYRRAGRTPRLALEHDKAPRRELAVVRHAGGHGQERVDLGRRWTGTGKLDRFEGAPGGEEF